MKSFFICKRNRSDWFELLATQAPCSSCVKGAPRHCGGFLWHRAPFPIELSCFSKARSGEGEREGLGMTQNNCYCYSWTVQDYHGNEDLWKNPQICSCSWSWKQVMSCIHTVWAAEGWIQADCWGFKPPQWYPLGDCCNHSWSHGRDFGKFCIILVFLRTKAINTKQQPLTFCFLINT